MITNHSAMKTTDQQDHGRQRVPMNTGHELPSDHAFQLLCLHPETLNAWEEAQEADAELDPEHARKLAAVRTELLQRLMQRNKSTE